MSQEANNECNVRHCKKCNSTNIYSVSAKCSDMCGILRPGSDTWESDYVPPDLRISDKYGDYVEFSWCEDCGQMQDKDPE